MKSISRLLLLALMSLFLVAGCGDSENNDNTLDPNNPSPGRQAHVNWNTYNVYQYSNGTWTPIITAGNPVSALPGLGDRPAFILHGLGSDIRSNRFNTLANSLAQSGATAILGFEYDSLDSVSKNGNFFLDALSVVTENSPGVNFRIIGHSMGGLVARVALESGIPLDVAPSGNRAVLVATPNLGSEIVFELQDNPDLIGEALGDLVLNGELEFRNFDGTLVNVTGQEQGFTDLRPDSAFLSALNFEAGNHHPQFEYRTVAGDERGDNYEALDRVLGVFADDGVVDISSANAAVIGPADTAVVDSDHTTIVEEVDSILVILTFAGF